jgi:uncharacterized repeat protein (TIGR02543 family)
MKRFLPVFMTLIYLLSLFGCQTVKAQTSRVQYDGNGSTGGTPPVDANQYLPGQNAVVMGNLGELVKQDSSFAGWNTKADGSGTQYQPGAALFMASYSVTLFARWKALPPPPLTVTYDGNGQGSGTVPIDDRSYERGKSFIVIGNIGNLEKRGYSFAGWNTRADGTGETWAQGSVVQLGTSSITLYARWIPLPPLPDSGYSMTGTETAPELCPQTTASTSRDRTSR